MDSKSKINGKINRGGMVSSAAAVASMIELNMRLIIEFSRKFSSSFIKHKTADGRYQSAVSRDQKRRFTSFQPEGTR